MTAATKRPTHCPTCDSPCASRFPATAFEGEALACPDEWHLTDPLHPPTEVMRGLVERGRALGGQEDAKAGVRRILSEDGGEP